MKREKKNRQTIVDSVFMIYYFFSEHKRKTAESKNTLSLFRFFLSHSLSTHRGRSFCAIGYNFQWKNQNMFLHIFFRVRARCSKQRMIY